MGFKRVTGALVGVLLAASMFVGKAYAVCPEGGPAPCLGRYGEFPNANLLVPWFVAGPGPANPLHQDTLIVEIDLQNATPVTGLNFTFWTRDSKKCFNKCLPSTPADVVPVSVFDTIRGAPPSVGSSCLDPDGDGVFEGYVTVESFQGKTCTGAPVPEGILGFIYQVQVQQGLVSGINAPTFASANHPPKGTDFEEFAVNGLAPDQSMVFKILNTTKDGSSKDDSQTTAVVWSATSGNCGIFPDSACLDTNFVACDEEEICFSLTIHLPREVNFVNADLFLPAGPPFFNGWFVLHNGSKKDLYVLGYSDNKAQALSSIFGRAIFPAPLVDGNPLP